MITPFLFIKDRLAQLRGRMGDEQTRIALTGVIIDLDHAIDKQAEEDRAHRDEVEALLKRGA